MALLSTLLTIVWCLVIYGQGMLNTAGSFALLSHDPVHGRDGPDHVSLRLRHETESAKRHGAGDGHAERRRGAGGGSGHSERGPAHRGDDRHVDPVVGRPRGRSRANDLRQAGGQPLAPRVTA
ncbi:MAG: hypothetical protein MZV64_04920 [Ignavibacteriales bacterium]|nr:hypothetical protein [Ignavibacteriales bacterium]